MSNKLPSFIHINQHPDWPQRFSELRDIDVFDVDWDDETKQYWIQFVKDPEAARNNRFWRLIEIDASWSAGNIIYEWMSPTTETLWGLPAWTDIFWWTVEQILQEMLVESTDPSILLKWTPIFHLYEIWDTITDPLIEANAALWQWPAGVLTQIEIFRGAVWWTSIFVQANPAPWTWYWGNDTNTINIIAWTSETYSAQVDDDQWRSWTITKIYEWTYPYFGTSVDIATLTQQTLRPLTSAYFSVNMVAEWGWEKYKADFEASYITITWVEFYDTSSNSWKRMWGTKANSLLLRDTTNVTHTVQGNVVNYIRFTHNWPDGWALQLRFYIT